MDIRRGVLAALVLVQTALAQTSTLVKDIYVPGLGPLGSRPFGFTALDATSVFFVSESPRIWLWRTDGTLAGTQRLREVEPCPSVPPPGRSLIVVAGGLAFFAGQSSDSNSGCELWRSDGTPAGTVEVRNIASGASASYPEELTAVGATLFFTADDRPATGNRELWKSDGTLAGTVLVREINPTQSGSSPSHLVAVGAVLFFAADDGLVGHEPWKSDGTPSGTVLVADVVAGPASSVSGSSSLRRAALGGSVYYTASDGRLWTSDGTDAGTRRAGDRADHVASHGGYVWFGFGPELWRTDGTAPQRVLWLDGGAINGPVVGQGAAVFFLADEPSSGLELWRADVAASGATLLRDVAPGAVSSFPQALTAAAGAVWFAGHDGVSGWELWRSDGTAGGTTLVKDLSPGQSSSVPGAFSELGGALLFAADDGLAGLEPWRSDGTSAGTVRVKDINGAATSTASNPLAFTAAGATLYFVARSGSTSGLFSSDGTTAGTRLVRDLEYAPTGYARSLAPLGSSLLFSAGAGLWRTDGDPAGTSLLHPLALPGGPLLSFGPLVIFGAQQPGSAWRTDGSPAGTAVLAPLTLSTSMCPPPEAVELGGTLYFTASTQAQGTELWKTDGTPQGTGLVSDLLPSSQSADPVGLTPVGSALFFFARRSPGGGYVLWKTDGTDAGTVLVSDIYPTGNPWLSPCNSGVPRQSVGVGGLLVFYASDGITGQEPWRSDGTPSGTFRLADLVPGIGTSWTSNCTGPSRASEPSFVALGNTALFVATDADAGTQVWRTDGTPLGTTRVTNSFNHCPGRLTVAAGEAWYQGFDSLRGWEVWRCDGVTAAPFTDLAINDPFGNSRALAATGGAFYFSGQGGEPWRVDRSTGAASMLANLGRDVPAGMAGELVPLGSGIFFAHGDETTGAEPYVSDGTTAGTRLVKDVRPGPVGSSPGLTVGNGQLVMFFADDGDAGREPWRSDGTAAGTFLVADTRPGPAGATGGSLVAAGSRFYFVADDGTHGLELWSSDGTSAGTAMVADLGGPGVAPSALTPHQGELYFVLGEDLWKSAGTAGTTARLHDFTSADGGRTTFSQLLSVGPRLYGVLGSRELWVWDSATARPLLDAAPRSVSELTRLKDRAFFLTSAAAGDDLWVTDGTDAGTRLIQRNAGDDVDDLVAVDDLLYFISWDSNGDETIWVSDGTNPGTQPLKDIRPQRDYSADPQGLTAVGRLLYFWADDGDAGRELWRSDGTTAGTELVQDLNPGPAGMSLSQARGLVPVGNTVFFAAGYEPWDVELWKFEAEATPPVIVAAVTGTAGLNGWYTSDVDVTWTVSDPESPVTRRVGCDPSRLTADTPSQVLTCEASSGGGTARTSIAIRRDATPPMMFCAPVVLAEATGPDGADAPFQVMVSDPTSAGADAGVAVTYSKAPGSRWPIGDSSESATAVDNAGNVSMCQYVVVVRDSTAPALDCPTDPAVSADTAEGASFEFPSDIVKVADLVDPAPSVEFDPPSRSFFSIGSTDVRVVARDRSGNERECTFTVTVIGCEGGGCRPTAQVASHFSFGCAAGGPALLPLLAALLSRRRRPAGAAVPDAPLSAESSATINSPMRSRISVPVRMFDSPPPGTLSTAVRMRGSTAATFAPMMLPRELPK